MLIFKQYIVLSVLVGTTFAQTKGEREEPFKIGQRHPIITSTDYHYRPLTNEVTLLDEHDDHPVPSEADDGEFIDEDDHPVPFEADDGEFIDEDDHPVPFEADDGEFIDEDDHPVVPSEADDGEFIDEDDHPVLLQVDNGEIFINEDHDHVPCEGEHVDLCGDGSTCSGLKEVFLELCFKSGEEISDCTTDCSFLLTQLKKEATKQGKALQCVDYVQKNLLSLCAVDTNYESLESDSCPSEDEWTNDLRPGDFDEISCMDLYPSGVMGGASVYRYCMYGGDVIVTNTCQIDEHILLSMSSYKNDSGHSAQGLRGGSRTNLLVGDNANDIKDGAEKSISILAEATSILDDANEAGVMLGKIGGLASKLGPALGALGLAFSIVNIFLPQPESPELQYMKKEFAVVNNKLDLLSLQLKNSEARIIYELFKQEFRVFKANIDSCGIILKEFQSDPVKSASDYFKSSCCLGDRAPLKYVTWISSNVPIFISDVIKAKEYQMDTFLNEMQAIMHTTIVASYYDAACTGLHYPNKTTVKAHMEVVTDLVNSVSNAVTTQIRKLPDDYIKYQLHYDVNLVVYNALSTRDCSDRLEEKIGTRMKGWRYKPLASTVCYNPVVGYDQHAVSAYPTKNEYYGFFSGFRIFNKFSVIIDWTDTENPATDMGYGVVLNQDIMKAYLAHYLSLGDIDITNPGFQYNGINFMRIWIDELLLAYGLKSRNVAYIAHGNGAAALLHFPRLYFINVGFYRTRSNRYYSYKKNYVYSVVFSVSSASSATISDTDKKSILASSSFDMMETW